MREIKFRAWHKDIKKMYKIGQITLEKGTWNYEPEDRDFIGMSKPYQPSFILMQYTGLKDKNGKEIYEGDIVYVVSEDENAFILWDEETARYIIQFDGWCADFDNYYAKELEVICNIYENKVLLENEGLEE